MSSYFEFHYYFSIIVLLMSLDDMAYYVGLLPTASLSVNGGCGRDVWWGSRLGMYGGIVLLGNIVGNYCGQVWWGKYGGKSWSNFFLSFMQNFPFFLHCRYHSHQLRDSWGAFQNCQKKKSPP